MNAGRGGAQPGRGSRPVRVAVGVVLPVVLILTNVRLLLTPVFVQAEYRSPGFPPDPYGFTLDDRLHWSGLALAYLFNDAGPEFLGDLRFEDGGQVFNEREVSHMLDVKILVRQALAGWMISSIGLGLLLVAARRAGGGSEVRRALHLGGRAALVAMAVLIAILIASFSFLFVGFHGVFFESGTWRFLVSDTLIRLFPERFWRDAFGLLLLLTLVEAGATAWLTRPRRGREPGTVSAGGLDQGTRPEA